MTQPPPEPRPQNSIPDSWAQPGPPAAPPTSPPAPPSSPDPAGAQPYSAPGRYSAPSPESPPNPGLHQGGAPYAAQQPYPPQSYPSQSYPSQPYPPSTYPGAPSQYAGSPYQPYAPAAPLSSAVPILRWLMIGAAVVVIVCAFLPWATATVLGTDVTVHGTDSGKDGWITLGMAVIAAIVAVISALTRKPGGIHLAAGIVSTAMGALIAVVALVDLGDLNNRSGEISDYGGNIDAGYGMIGTILFGVVLLALGIAGIIKRR